jgi:hypothetical protein
MNISLKKTAIATILVTGIAGALTLQAHEVPDTMDKDSGSEDRASEPMGMKNMQGMMGMKGQMGEMMAACTKMMEVHANDHQKQSGEDETQG